MPPLLADMIRRALINRAGFSSVTEIADPGTDGETVRALAPDIVIIMGGAGDPWPVGAALRRSLPPKTVVLAISADLSRLLGPGKDDSAEFSADALVELARRGPASA